jgi:hypothetical protein
MRRAKAPQYINTPDGNVRLKYAELLPSLAQGANNFSFVPRSTGLAKLDSIAQGYDQFKVHAARAEYRTSSGTTATGHTYLGIDYGAGSLNTTVQEIATLNPRVDGPLWENMDLNVDPAKAMTKRVMTCGSVDPDDIPFVVSCWTDQANSGVLWLHYDVEFIAPTTPPTGNSSQIRGTVTYEWFNQPGGLVPIGTPEVTDEVSIGVEGTVDPAARTLTSEFVEPQASGGQLFAVNSVTSSLLASNSSANFTVTFLDASTLAPLPSGVVQPVGGITRVDGFLSSVWQFVKPFAKSFIIKVVETILALPSTQTAKAEELAHVLTTSPLKGSVGALTAVAVGDYSVGWGTASATTGYTFSQANNGLYTKLSNPSGGGPAVLYGGSASLPATSAILVSFTGNASTPVIVPVSSSVKIVQLGATTGSSSFYSWLVTTAVNFPLDSEIFRITTTASGSNVFVITATVVGGTDQVGSPYQTV